MKNTDELALDVALEMLRENPTYIQDAKKYVKFGNTVVGSLIASTYKIPRQYSEMAVLKALQIMGK